MADNRSDQVVELLRSIDASLKGLRADLARQQAPAAADDRDLDGQYGDPILRFNPRDWTGHSFKGSKFSECPADLLDMVAETLDYFARKAEESGELANNGKPVAPYKRKDAARARGWAARIRGGYRVNRSTGELTEPGNSFDDTAPDAQDFADGSEWPTDQDVPF
jgi:hypothetical protein